MNRSSSASLLAFVSFLLLSPDPSRAGLADNPSGIQVTPDGARTLVSKDVGGERWAIARNPDGTVTGNVFFAAGGAPKFVWCNETSNANGQLGFACSGSDACPLGPCDPDEWTFITDVTLPESFFSPTSGEAAAASTAALLSELVALKPMRRFLEVAAGTDDGDSPSGLQITPDGRTLISKDVGAERWAISRNDDGTITGNVFFPGGGEPKFVWCEQTAEADGNLSARCLGANPCARDGVTDCAGTGWTFIADVTLPVSFFQPREVPDTSVLESTLVADLGEDGAFQAVALALERGYSLDQILRAALTKRLRPSGEIVAPSGTTEPPSGPTADLFTDVAATSGLGHIAATTSVDQFQKKFKEKSKGLTTQAVIILLFLIDQGYSIQQIVLEVFFGNAGFTLVDGKLRLTNGNTVIPPDGPPRFGINRCGNGVHDDSEKCEGTALESYELTCATFGMVGGAITSCTAACQYDVGHCSGCGNGKREGSEACDGDDLAGKSCQSLGFASGGLYCGLDCTLRLDNCTSCTSGGSCCGEGEKPCGGSCIPSTDSCCGDGFRDGLEQCDNTDLGGATCASQGRGSGDLECSGSCTFDYGDCTGSGGCQGDTFACEGGCVPNGADCCEGEGGYCAPGSVCVGNNACCPASNPQPCGNQCLPEGATCCEGTSCCGNGNIDGTEVCDGAVGCGSGEACSSSCDSCVSDVQCNNGIVEIGEACDPPGSDDDCGSGEVCASDCKTCVSTISCEGRCCAGRNDDCTPPGVACYCDQYCVENGDCCADYGASCG